MEHLGIVVYDLAAAIEFFVQLGLELQGQRWVEGRWVDHVVGLEGGRADIAMLETPDGHGRLELTKFHTPSPQGGDKYAPSSRLQAQGTKLVGELESYEDSYRLCYVRGWLTVPIAAVALFWFRRGWTVRWTSAAIALAFVLPPFGDQSHFSWIDLWLTRDQQGGTTSSDVNTRRQQRNLKIHSGKEWLWLAPVTTRTR
jgi:hypothetical protein